MSVVSASRNLSLQDATSAYSFYEPAVLSIEELRLHLYTCFTCGVCWLQDHVCLDCEECGGYSLQRPCVQCDGSCGSLWKRDLTLSHASGKARWSGTCQKQTSTSPQKPSAEGASRVCANLANLHLGS